MYAQANFINTDKAGRGISAMLHCPSREIWGRWAMDPFSFASSEALDIPLNIRMCVS
jgi:hypothetical protein